MPVFEFVVVGIRSSFSHDCYTVFTVAVAIDVDINRRGTAEAARPAKKAAQLPFLSPLSLEERVVVVVVIVHVFVVFGG